MSAGACKILICFPKKARDQARVAAELYENGSIGANPDREKLMLDMAGHLESEAKLKIVLEEFLKTL